MAVISCRLKFQEYVAGELNSDRLALTYHVATDGPMSLSAVLVDCYTATPNAIPRRYTYVGDGMYVLQMTVRPRNDDSRTKFVIGVDCGKPAMQDLESYANPEDWLTNPLARLPVFLADVQSKMERIEKDKDGKPILNAAGDKYDEPIERDEERPVILIRRNLPTAAHVIELNRRFKRTANSDTINFQGLPFAAGSLQWRGASASEPTIENQIQYYATTIRIAADTRYADILNRGHRARKEIGGNPVWVTDDEGQRLPDPVLLDADGLRLAEGGVPVFKQYDIHTNKAFAPLFAAAPLDFNVI